MNPSYQHFATHDKSEYPELWEGCVGAWAPCLGPSGDRLNDLSGRANWGTLTSMDPATDWVVDGGRHTLDFDGSNDFVSIQNRDYGFAGEVSFSLWARPLVNQRSAFLVQSDGSFATFALVFSFNSARTVEFWHDAARSSIIESTTALTIGELVHLAFVRTPAKREIWINGVLDNSAAGPVTANSFNSNMGISIGRFGTFAGYYLGGRVFDLMAYRRGLSQAEIRTLATSPGIAYTPRRRFKAYFLGPTFNAAWARGSNVTIQPCGVA